MQPWDDRGQSIQVGAVLIFAALILLLSLYQASVVPQQNEQVEFDHSQQVQGELLDLRNAVVSTVGDSARRSVSVGLGTTYPPRVLSMNPPPVSGQLRTVGTADGNVAFGIENAEALDGETADFWDGRQRNYVTGAAVYRPNYNEYGQPPTTVYENSVLYDDFSFEGSTVARSDQGLIDGDAITLVALNGSLRRSSSGRTSVDVRPISASATTVTVENASPTEPVTVRVPTRLDETAWEELLADQRVGAGGNVTDVGTTAIPGTTEFELLVIELTPGTYDLRMAKAGVGTRVTGESAAYVTDVRGNGSTVPEGGTARFVVEVRDQYNNPVGGERVTASASWRPDGGRTKRTTDDGRAAFVYETSDDAGGTDGRVNVSLGTTVPSGSFRGGSPDSVSLNVTVTDTDVTGSGGGDGAGPAVTEPGATPDPVNQGETVTLSATVSDVERGGLDVVEAEWFRAGPGETVPGQDPGNGSANRLAVADGEWDQPTEVVTATPTAAWPPGEHTVAFRGRDANGNWGAIRTTTVTVTQNVLVTAVQPDPEQLPDGDGEFVRLEVPSGVDTSGWVLADSESGETTQSIPDVDGTVYFARDPGAFASQWDGVDPNDVERLEIELNDDGDSVAVRDSAGAVVDRFAYGGSTFGDGSSFDFGDGTEGQVASRLQSDGRYVDTDGASDWTEQTECSFFGGDGCEAQPVLELQGQPDTSNVGDLEFDVENVGSTTGSVDSITVEAPGYPQLSGVERNGGSRVQVNPANGYARLDSDLSFGTTYELDGTAGFDPRETGSVTVREFVNDGGQSESLGTLTRVDSRSDADIVVTLGLADGPDQVFSFQRVPSADLVEYAGSDGSAPGESDGELRFDVENTGVGGVTVTQFSVDDSVSDVISRNWNPGVVDFGQQGGAESGFFGFFTDGTVYSLDTPGTISGSATAEVHAQNFQTAAGFQRDTVDLSDYSHTGSQSESDITFTLYFGDGSSRSYYFTDSN